MYKTKQTPNNLLRKTNDKIESFNNNCNDKYYRQNWRSIKIRYGDHSAKLHVPYFGIWWNGYFMVHSNTPNSNSTPVFVIQGEASGPDADRTCKQIHNIQVPILWICSNYTEPLGRKFYSHLVEFYIIYISSTWIWVRLFILS